MCAVSAGREGSVALLLEAGADVNLENENRETVIHMTRGRTLPYHFIIDRTPILKMVIDKIQDIDKQVYLRQPIHCRTITDSPLS